jgi:hypothetical protein
LPAPPPPAKGCPSLGWAEDWADSWRRTSHFNPPTPRTCRRPTAIFINGRGRLSSGHRADQGPGVGRYRAAIHDLATPADLLNTSENAGEPKLRPLTLAARSETFHGLAGCSEGAGAIVEADGNMLVAQNSYPVYASVHMNKSYFDTARKNLIATGGYQSQPPPPYVDVGAAVFKATWLRLDEGQQPPPGRLHDAGAGPGAGDQVIPGLVTILPLAGKFVTVTVALLGLHVVGYTDNHPVFLWGTFEKMNSPVTADNTFTPRQAARIRRAIRCTSVTHPFRR